MNTSYEIGKKIRSQRLKLNLTMEYVAKQSRITRASLYEIEKGTPHCSFASVLSVMQTLNMDIEISVESLEFCSRKRASRISTALEKKINRFIIMCVEQYAEYSNKSSSETYKLITDKGIIKELQDDYEDLYGMSTAELNNYIHSLLLKR